MVNGFEVDKYNQYGLDDKRKQNVCPKCSDERKPKNQRKKVLMCDWQRGIGTCQHCGEVIQLHTYKKKSEDFKPSKMKTYQKPKTTTSYLSDKVAAYFKTRGISKETLIKAKVGSENRFMPQENKPMNVICFNYFRNGELVNVKYRDSKKNFMMVSGAERIVYNYDAISKYDELIFVEGEVDALSYMEAGFDNVISVPNGSTNGNINLQYLDDCIDLIDGKKIILALDDDEPGQNHAKELARRLGTENLFLADLSNLKDANEVLTQLGVESLKNSIKNASEYPISDVECFEDSINELEDFFDNGEKAGFKIGLDSFDNVFSTYTGQFVVVTGLPRSGKSDFVDQMTIGYAMKYGWRTAYCSVENKPSKHHKRKLFKKIAGYEPKTRAEFCNSKAMMCRSFLNDHFYFIDKPDRYELKEVLSKAEELVKRKGIKCLVLDPFNKITLKDTNRNDTNIYTGDWINEVDTFCRKNDVFVIVVAHPVKVQKDKDGERMMPDFYDIKGGGEWFDMSYHGLCVHRNWKNNTVKIKVMKVKFDNLGENEAEVNFVWNINNGRFTETIGASSDPLQMPDGRWDNSCWIKADEQVAEQVSFYNAENDFLNQRADAPF